MQKEKINWLSILRGWAVLLVVIKHSCPNVDSGLVSDSLLNQFNEVFGFRMPLFFFISGYLLYYTKLRKASSFRSIWKERIPRIVYPYFFITLILFCIKFFLSGQIKREVDFSLLGFLNCFLYPENLPWTSYWFLNVILLYFLSYPLLKIILKNSIATGVTLLVAVGLHLYFPKGVAFLDLSTVFYMFVFFFGGILVAKFDLVKYMKGWTVFAFVLVVFLLFNLLEINNLPYSITGISLFISISLACEKYVPALFSSFRNYYYQIYLLGNFAQAVILVNLVKVNNDFQLLGFVLAAIIVGLYVPVLISKAIQRLKWKPLLRVIGF